MRALLLAAIALSLLAVTSTFGASAQAQTRKPATHIAPANAPHMLGKFEDWIAATHQEAGQTVCYAFVRAQSSVPSVSGRGEVVLTVTERPTGRDAVAISAGFAFAPGAEVLVQVDRTGLHFYTAQRNAFARDGGEAVATFMKGREAIARMPGPRSAQITDTFSLRGFAQAYAAIGKACPPAR